LGNRGQFSPFELPDSLKDYCSCFQSLFLRSRLPVLFLHALFIFGWFSGFADSIAGGCGRNRLHSELGVLRQAVLAR
jgi:hypothetical protein